MKFKIWDSFNKVMYYNAEMITDDKWHLGRLHNNKHCTTCVTIGKKDKRGIDIYTYDMLLIGGDLFFYVCDFSDGEALLKGINNNLKEHVYNFDEKDIEVVGSVLELNKLEAE